MNHQQQKQIVKNAQSNCVLEPFDYLINLSESHIFNKIIDDVNAKCKEREKIAWNCVSCQRPIEINAINFSSLKHVDYLCSFCKDNIKTDALMVGILKSSNNLRLLLQNKLYKNYDKKNILS